MRFLTEWVINAFACFYFSTTDIKKINKKPPKKAERSTQIKLHAPEKMWIWSISSTVHSRCPLTGGSSGG